MLENPLPQPVLRPQRLGDEYRWIVLVTATIAQACACFLVQGIGAMAEPLQNAFRLNTFELGLLVSAAQLIPLIGLLIAGELLDRYNERYVVGIGTALVSIAIFLASEATTYHAILFCLLLVGAGYSTAQPGGSKSIATWFSQKERGFAMGIRQAGLPLGGAAAAALMPWISFSHGWRNAFKFAAGVTLFGAIIFVIFYRSKLQARQSDHVAQKSLSNLWAMKIKDRFAMIHLPIMRKIVFSGLVMISFQTSLLLFLLLFLRDHMHLATAFSGHYLLYALLAGTIGRIVLAAWSDHCERGRFFVIRVSMLGGLLGLIVLSVLTYVSVESAGHDGANLMFLGLCIWLGFFGFGWYGPWVALVSESVPPERVGFALGLAMMVNQIAIIFCPPFFGYLKDLSHSYLPMWLMLSIGLMVALFCTIDKKKIHTKKYLRIGAGMK